MLLNRVVSHDLSVSEIRVAPSCSRQSCNVRNRYPCLLVLLTLAHVCKYPANMFKNQTYGTALYCGPTLLCEACVLTQWEHILLRYAILISQARV